jgi:hypothetical protein
MPPCFKSVESEKLPLTDIGAAGLVPKKSVLL